MLWMMLSDAWGSNQRLKTKANFNAAEGDASVDDADADLASDDGEEGIDPILLSRIALAATLRLNCALAPMLRIDIEAEAERAEPLPSWFEIPSPQLLSRIRSI